MPIPGLFGGSKLADLLGRFHGDLVNMDPSTDWVGVTGCPGAWAALDFDGTNDYVDTAFRFGTYKGITVNALVKRPVGSTANRGILSDRTGTNGIKLGITNVETMQIQVYADSTFLNYVALDKIDDDDQWHMATFVIDDSGLPAMYLDGNDISGSFSAFTTETVGGDATIGLWLTNEMEMSLASLSIWNRALSAAEVKAVCDQSNRYYPDMLRRVENPAKYLIEAAGGFNPAWAIGASSRMIGSGVA